MSNAVVHLLPARASSWCFVALMGALAGCAQERESAPASEPVPPTGSVVEDARASQVGVAEVQSVDVPQRDAGPLPVVGRPPPQAGVLPTSTRETEPAAVWGAVIGGNVGAAQACGAEQTRLQSYLDSVAPQIEQAAGTPDAMQSYREAYEQARSHAAALSRDTEACRQVLASLPS
ncbi:MAG: hypothetical protein ACTIJY_08090 [Luteimonas sp.]